MGNQNAATPQAPRPSPFPTYLTLICLYSHAGKQRASFIRSREFVMTMVIFILIPGTGAPRLDRGQGDPSMAAQVGELLPSLHNVVQEVVQLAHQAIGAGPEHMQPRLELLHLVLHDTAALALATRCRGGALHLFPRRLHGGARAPELAHPDPGRARPVGLSVSGLLRQPLLQHHDGRHEAGPGVVRAARAAGRGGARDGAAGEDEQEERARVVERVQQPPEAVEARKPRVRRAQQQPLVELQRERRDPRVRQRAVLLLRGHGLPPRHGDRPHHLRAPIKP
jgi:hypothetical protein